MNLWKTAIIGILQGILMCFVFLAGTNYRTTLSDEQVEKLLFVIEDRQSQELVMQDFVQQYSDSIGPNGYRWTAEDKGRLAPYYLKHDIPVEAGFAILMAENSGAGSKMGILWSWVKSKMGISLFGRGIRATTRKSEWDYAASAMLLDRGTYRFLLSRPDIYAKMHKRYLKNPKQNQEDLILDHPDDWSEFIVYKIYKPGNKEMWKSVMLRELKKGEKK